MSVYTFTIKIKKEDSWYIVQCAELPGAISQGKDLKEAMANIEEAIRCHIEAFPEEFEKIRHKIEKKNKVIEHKLPLELAT